MTSLWPILAGVLAVLAVLLLIRRRAELGEEPAPRVDVLRPTPPPRGRIIVVSRRPAAGIDENAGPDVPTPDADRLLRRI